MSPRPQNPFAPPSRKQRPDGWASSDLIIKLSRFFVNPLNIGLLLTALGVYLHLFVEPPTASWTETSAEQIIRTRAAPIRRDPTEFKAAPPKPKSEHASLLEEDKVDPDFATVPDIITSALLKETPAEIASRHLRFPSVQDRIRLYMGSWYTPPCPDNTDALIPYRYLGKSSMDGDLLVKSLASKDRPSRIFRVGHDIEMARMVNLNRDAVLNCTSNDYCTDAIQYWVPALNRVEKEKNPLFPVPTLVQFGDSDTCKSYDYSDGSLQDFPGLPYVMKFRFRFQGDTAIRDMTTSQGGRDCLSGPRSLVPTVDQPRAAGDTPYFQPLIWRLTSLRHYGMMPEIPAADRPWSEKKDIAIWRGALTGKFH